MTDEQNRKTKSLIGYLSVDHMRARAYFSMDNEGNPHAQRVRITIENLPNPKPKNKKLKSKL